MAPSIASRWPDPPVDRLVTALTPPPRFAGVRFSTYEPDPAHPAQAAALPVLSSLAARLREPPPTGPLAAFRRRRRPETAPSVYLDGGFGVGKTHLLASLWHAAGPRETKTYVTFAGLVGLVGALSLRRAVDALRGTRLVCIDEFELDDPANTRLVARLLSELVSDGASVAATSNTLPGQQGAGRFSAEHFRREISTLAGYFEVLTIDGEDYRHRGAMNPPPAWNRAEVVAAAEALGDAATLDEGRVLQGHLAALHPIRYRALVEGLAAVFVVDATPVRDLGAALRVAYLVDVLYDLQIPVGLAGVEIAALFPAAFLGGSYRKTLGRCVSRMGALLAEAERFRRPPERTVRAG